VIILGVSTSVTFAPCSDGLQPGVRSKVLNARSFSDRTIRLAISLYAILPSRQIST